MIFEQTCLPGAFRIEIEPNQDERGFFARAWCQENFAAQGLETRLVQCNISFNRAVGTLRGMHFQAAPCSETKVVRCTRGAIHDVIVDLRPDSPTYKRSYATVLSAENRRMLYVPKLVAHGFLTLEPDTEVFYQMSEFYQPELGRGARWDDPAFGIVWPAPVNVISKRDASYPDFVR